MYKQISIFFLNFVFFHMQPGKRRNLKSLTNVHKNLSSISFTSLYTGGFWILIHNIIKNYWGILCWEKEEICLFLWWRKEPIKMKLKAWSIDELCILVHYIESCISHDQVGLNSFWSSVLQIMLLSYKSHHSRKSLTTFRSSQ